MVETKHPRKLTHQSLLKGNVLLVAQTANIALFGRLQETSSCLSHSVLSVILTPSVTNSCDLQLVSGLQKPPEMCPTPFPAY